MNSTNEKSHEKGFMDIGFAKLDIQRESRVGTSEAIFCKGKTCSQLLKIIKAFREKGCAVLGTKCSVEQANFILKNGEKIFYDSESQIISMKDFLPIKNDDICDVAVCCGGTADLPIAEEAAKTLEFYKVKVARHYDIGIAGLHRLLSKIENIKKAKVVIAVAGMEGALPGVLAGLVKSPVVAVPTSVGYGASFNGISALLTMLNTCAEGVTVVNIDNGFGAAISAIRMLKIKEL